MGEDLNELERSAVVDVLNEVVKGHESMSMLTHEGFSIVVFY